MAGRFKKGDRVGSTCTDKSYGKIGTIVYPRHESYCVKFEDFKGHNGHDGGNFYSDKCDCWFVHEKCLEFVSEQQDLKLKQTKEKGEMEMFEKIMSKRTTEEFLLVKSQINSSELTEMVIVAFFKDEKNIQALIDEAKKRQEAKNTAQ